MKQVKNGDQVICTAERDYDYPGVRAGILAQHVGDVLMVNSVHGDNAEHLGGVMLNEQPYTTGREPKSMSQSRIGLGGSISGGAYRILTPSDPEYVAPRAFWEDRIGQELKRERAWTFLSTSLAIVLLGYIALAHMP